MFDYDTIQNCTIFIIGNWFRKMYCDLVYLLVNPLLSTEIAILKTFIASYIRVHKHIFKPLEIVAAAVIVLFKTDECTIYYFYYESSNYNFVSSFLSRMLIHI